MAVNTPKELRNQMMYQIFVRNFSEEGTFRKVRERLDEIKELGTDIIWLMPIHPIGKIKRKGSLGSPYAISDYRAVNPEFGTPEDFKALVEDIHAHDMKCIIDVVYNHTYRKEHSFFNMTVPKYYYRFEEDGSWMHHSFCGNDTASERAMYSKFMVESVYYWAKEYHLDGFRFDIMSLHDTDTMRKIRETLDTLDRRILMYGEAWDMGDVDGVELSTQKNISKLDRVAAFNDGLRDGVKGSVFEIDEKGFVQGDGNAQKIQNGVLGATNEWADTPADTVTLLS